MLPTCIANAYQALAVGAMNVSVQPVKFPSLIIFALVQVAEHSLTPKVLFIKKIHMKKALVICIIFFRLYSKFKNDFGIRSNFYSLGSRAVQKIRRILSRIVLRTG